VTEQKHYDHQPPPKVLKGLELIDTVTIRFVPQKEQRYETVGDWEIKGKELVVTATRYDDLRWSWAIAFHELVEAAMCTLNGVTSQEVDEFDMGQGIEYEEPGRHPSAPYHREHLLAFALERKLADAMGVDWKLYDATLTDKGVRDVNETRNERAPGSDR
jgi:hypothetical protein